MNASSADRRLGSWLLLSLGVSGPGAAAAADPAAETAHVQLEEIMVHT